jgi:hypothetical protein
MLPPIDAAPPDVGNCAPPKGTISDPQYLDYLCN